MRRNDIFTVDYLMGSRARGLFGDSAGIRRVLDFASAKEGQTIVDLGTGLGYLLSLIEDQVSNARLIGIDVGSELIGEARAINQPANPGNTFEFCVADARSTELPDETADLTVCCALLVHPPRPEEILREMIRITKPGGCVVAVEPFPTNLLPQLWYDADAGRKDREMGQQRRVVNETSEPESDYEIALRLPALMEMHGLVDIEVEVLPVFRRYSAGFEKYTVSLWMLVKGRRPPGTL